MEGGIQKSKAGVAVKKKSFKVRFTTILPRKEVPSRDIEA
jgi:hypothetical protein